MWYTTLVIVHILSCFFLIAVVLLQQGKGSDVSAVFGGSSQTIFGSSGAGNLLTKLTTGTAIVFMLTSLTLTYGTARETSKSVFDDVPLGAPAGTPPVQPSKEAKSQGAPATPTGETTQAAPTPAATPPAAPASAPATPLSGPAMEGQMSAPTAGEPPQRSHAEEVRSD
jgi:preprotein translocase subunit SecG